MKRVKKKTKKVSKRQREVIVKALVDAKFRRELKSNPAKALGIKRELLTAVRLKEIDFILSTVKGIEAYINATSDSLLCVDPEPCGIC